MKLLILDTHDPYLNLATEEYLLRYTDDDIFMLWQNEPSVIVGRNQNVYAEINTELARERGIHVVRRITGGGAVYHDFGNVNYSFISRSDGNGIDFERFTAPIIKALRSLGVECELSGRNDLISGGRKFSGNAQYSTDNRTLHHGTLLFSSDLSVLSNVLRVDPEKIRSKAVKSTRSRVCNLSEIIGGNITTDDFIALIADFVKREYGASIDRAPESEQIEAIRRRNASNEWIYPTATVAAGYDIVRKKRYPTCLLEISLAMVNDTVRDISISGDFFGSGDISELENLIKGSSISSLYAVLSAIDINAYIYGIDARQLVDLIKGGEE